MSPNISNASSDVMEITENLINKRDTTTHNNSVTSINPKREVLNTTNDIVLNPINKADEDTIKFKEDFLVSNDLEELFSGNNQFLFKNFINFKSNKTFIEFLEEYIKQT